MKKTFFDHTGGRKFIGMLLITIILVIYVFKGFMSADTSLLYLTPLWLGYGTLNILSKIVKAKDKT